MANTFKRALRRIDWPYMCVIQTVPLFWLGQQLWKSNYWAILHFTIGDFVFISLIVFYSWLNIRMKDEIKSMKLKDPVKKLTPDADGKVPCPECCEDHPYRSGPCHTCYSDNRVHESDYLDYRKKHPKNENK